MKTKKPPSAGEKAFEACFYTLTFLFWIAVVFSSIVGIFSAPAKQESSSLVTGIAVYNMITAPVPSPIPTPLLLLGPVLGVPIRGLFIISPILFPAGACLVIITTTYTYFRYRFFP